MKQTQFAHIYHPLGLSLNAKENLVSDYRLSVRFTSNNELILVILLIKAISICTEYLSAKL